MGLTGAQAFRSAAMDVWLCATYDKRLESRDKSNAPDIGVQGPLCCITRRDEVLKAPVNAFISRLKEAGRSLSDDEVALPG